MHLYRCPKNPQHFSSSPDQCALCDYHASEAYVNRAQGGRLEEFTAKAFSPETRLEVLDLLERCGIRPRTA